MKADNQMMPVFDLQTHHHKVEVPTDFDLRDLSKKYALFPLKVILMNGKRKLLLAMKNPFDGRAIQDVEFRTGLTVVPVHADDKDIQWLTHTHYYGRKLSPTPSVAGDEITHDVFAQFEMVTNVQKAPGWITDSIKPFTKEEK